VEHPDQENNKNNQNQIHEDRCRLKTHQTFQQEKNAQNAIHDSERKMKIKEKKEKFV
jgi:hypothetical protein